MPTPISDRFRFEVYLGRDGDIDEWLGADDALDRPVLIRLLAPDAPPERVTAFLDAVRAAALSHVHVADVYAADRLATGQAYAVQEWGGGVTLADRLQAGESLPIEEFLPNAAGLASALAALHDAGAVHGGVAPRAILFSAAHPAKLSGFGRAPTGAGPASTARDVRALARALAMAATGGPPPARLAPSQLAAGLPREVDRALQAADRGELDAAALAARLRAAPTVRRSRTRAFSWQWLAPAAILLAVAAATAGIGLALREQPSESPFLFPAVPVTTASSPSAPSDDPGQAAPDPPADAPRPVTVQAAVYDPFGDDAERDADLPLLADGDPESGWRTERYLDPLRRVKQGLGLAFDTRGSPLAVEVLASDGIGFTVAWSPEMPANFDAWTAAATGRVVGGRARVQLPHRDGGVWLLWITDLPAQEGGEFYYGFVYEVRFQA